MISGAFVDLLSHGVLVDPAEELCYPCVYSRQTLFCALDAPRHDSYQSPLCTFTLNHQGSSGIPLAGVLTAFPCAGAQEDLGDGLRELGLALRVVPHRQRYLPQNVARRATERQRSPTDDGGQFADKRFVGTLGQADGPDVLGEAHTTTHAQQGDVVLVRVLAEVRVLPDSRYVEVSRQPASGVLLEVVLSQSHRDVLRSKPLSAMGGRNHISIADQSTAAELVIIRFPQKSSHPCPVIRLGDSTTHDPCLEVQAARRRQLG